MPMNRKSVIVAAVLAFRHQALPVGVAVVSVKENLQNGWIGEPSGFSNLPLIITRFKDTGEKSGF
jgi:hypothetical protein